MHTRHLAALLAAGVTIAIADQPASPAVAFPEGYRSWQLVRSIIVGPEHRSFERRGGFHHYYANAQAVEGYRTGTFPDGAVIVDEAVWAKDGEGQAKGIQYEGDRRALDVMTKNAAAFKDTGGWGYEHFDGQDPAPRLNTEKRAACSECHAKAERDHVYTKIRP